MVFVLRVLSVSWVPCFILLKKKYKNIFRKCFFIQANPLTFVRSIRQTIKTNTMQEQVFNSATATDFLNYQIGYYQKQFEGRSIDCGKSITNTTWRKVRFYQMVESGNILEGLKFLAEVPQTDLERMKGMVKNWKYNLDNVVTHNDMDELKVDLAIFKFLIDAGNNYIRLIELDLIAAQNV